MRRLIAAWLLGGCGGEAFVAVDGPASYRVVVATDVVTAIVCPGDPVAGLRCEDGGVAVEDFGTASQVTVNARGFRTVSAEVDRADLPLRGGRRVWDSAIAALPTSEDTADYATGFDEDGLGRFEAMAVHADTELGPASLVKFYIADIGGDPQVYFQDTVNHPLHYDFARDVLSVPGTATDFFVATYRGEDRTAMAGTLVRYGTVEAESQSLGTTAEAPIAITFFPSDNLSPAQALLAHDLVEERLGFSPLDGGGPDRLVYLPAGSDGEDELLAARLIWDRRAAPFMLRRELWGQTRLQILNRGEAYGTLRRLTPEDLETTVVSFRDVLVLPRLPNELAGVAGTISEEFQTPLAHVNVAAIARGTPNVAWLDGGTDPNFTALLGRLVHFVVLDGSFTLAEATIEEAEAYWEAHRPDPVTLEADLEREGLPLFSDVGFEDALAIGVKAANLAELHNLLPDVAPAGFAVPFRYYAEFLASNTLDAPLCAAAHADCVTEGRDTFSCDGARALCDGAPPSTTLADYAARLVADPGFGSDTALRDAALDGLRYAIRNSVVSPVFAAALDGRVQQVFGAARVRLRSSTNAEDLPRFSGAGLYDSYSAGGADDLPSDEIRKVWASAWNFRAFEERSYWGVDHAGVAMGVAVSASYPDERANGALITQNIADPSVAGMYVNVQAGEMPVTNPEDGAIPEIFSILPGDSTGEVQVARLSYSSLSPSTPLLSTAEVLALHQAATAVQEHMAVLYEESPYSLALDIEFKFTGPERRLILKQVRPFAGY